MRQYSGSPSFYEQFQSLWPNIILFLFPPTVCKEFLTPYSFHNTTEDIFQQTDLLSFHPEVAHTEEAIGKVIHKIPLFPD